MPCDLARIVEIGRRRGIPVIEDAACASGSEILWNGRWEKIGRPHGDIACFSFHPRKVITTGDGGMITTANPELDRKFRLWRQHSMSVPDTVRHGAREVIFESYPEVGFNFRMTDMQAAVGRVQLTRLPAIVAERRRIAARIRGAAGGRSTALRRRSSRRGPAPTGRATASSCRHVRSAAVMQRDARRRCLDPARRDELRTSSGPYQAAASGARLPAQRAGTAQGRHSAGPAIDGPAQIQMICDRLTEVVGAQVPVAARHAL